MAWREAVVQGALRFSEPNQLRIAADAASGEILAIGASERPYIGPESTVSGLSNLADLASPQIFGVEAGALLRSLCGDETGDRGSAVSVRLAPERLDAELAAARIASPATDWRDPDGEVDELVVVAVYPSGHEYRLAGPAERTLGGVNYVCDSLMNLVSVDTAMNSEGLDLGRLIGMNSALSTHPCDQASSMEEFRSLLRDEVDEIQVVRRVLGPGGAWIRANLRARRLVGSGPTGAAYVVFARFADHPVQELPVGVLSESESDVVAWLLEGWRVPQIAMERNSSPKTVRNQLSAAYAKLGVSGQAELIERYGDRFQYGHH